MAEEKTIKSDWLRLNNKIINLNKWVDFDQSLHDEEVFQEALRLERKRSERSGRPFLLMLIDIKKSIQSKSGKIAFRKMVSQLIKTHSRETDIKGWHTHKSVIGIIFTETGDHDKDFIMEAITRRARNSLFYIVESKYLHEMKLSLQWFPNESNREENNYEPNPLFYPDVIEKTFHKVVPLFIKRIIDITGSIMAFIVFSPLFLIIPILIKMTSKGPVFFKQERLGLFGKKFTFLKFRTMYLDCDDSLHREYIKNLIANGNNENGENRNGNKPGENGLYKIRSDPRVTLIGKFLRKTSLDELPQFINVLKGDMSLVGPRPPIPYECDEYKIWHMRRVIEVKPGITGLWQVEGRSSTCFDEMVRLDLKYLREWSLWLDIMIILKTPWAVLSSKGAY